MHRMVAIGLCVFAMADVRAADVDDGKLLEQLRSDDFDARVKAQTRLIALGMQARAKIDAELERKDLEPDYRDALRAIRARLKNDQVLKEFDNPKRADFDFTQAKVHNVIEALNTHFGASIRMREETDRVVTVQLKQATLAEALEALRAAGHLAYVFDDTDPKQFLLRENPLNSPYPAMAKGPLIVVLNEIAVERRLNFAEEAPKPVAAHRNFTLAGTVLLQPGTRYTLLEISGVQLKPKAGDALAFEAAEVVPYPFQNEPGEDATELWSRQSFSGTLDSAGDAVGTLGFGAMLKVSIPIRTTETTLGDLAEKIGKPQEVLGGTFTLEKCAEDKNGWQAQFKINDALANSAVGRAMGWATQNAASAGNPACGDSMVILNAAGKPIVQTQAEEAPDAEQFRVTLELSEKPEKIVFRKVVESATREFEIKIGDVPTP